VIAITGQDGRLPAALGGGGAGAPQPGGGGGPHQPAAGGAGAGGGGWSDHGPGSVMSTIVGQWAKYHYAGTVSERTEADIALANRRFTESWLTEDDPLTQARPRGHELGAVPIGSGGGAVLRFLAASIAARAVVEVGTGAGVSGTWLLRGMADDGVLTSIDLQAENQRVARETYEKAGFAASRVRLISGRALEVLPRLSDAAYDLVFVDAAKSEYADYLGEALRLLRPGGIVAFDNTLWHGRVADSSNRDADTVAIRDLLRQVHDDGRLVPLLLPSGDGLLAAVLRPSPADGPDDSER
jgi:predicted O-methyltransferase YrrM